MKFTGVVKEILTKWEYIYKTSSEWPGAELPSYTVSPPCSLAWLKHLGPVSLKSRSGEAGKKWWLLGGRHQVSFLLPFLTELFNFLKILAHCAACGSVSDEMGPGPQQWKHWTLTTRPPGNSLFPVELYSSIKALNEWVSVNSQGKKWRIILNAMVKDTKRGNRNQTKEFSTHLASSDFTQSLNNPLREGKTDHLPDLVSRHTEGTQSWWLCLLQLRKI